MSDFSLTLTRQLRARPDQLFRFWTEAEHYPAFFCPKPWVAHATALDPLAGGVFNTVMDGPDGEHFENLGQFLHVEQNRRLVFSDAYVGDWVPSGKAFMTADVTFEPDGDGTLYTATVHHWSEEDMKSHEAMGFYEGWGIVADQLDDLAQTL